MKSDSRARHETINRMFKEWNILQNRFRYSIQKHGIVFGAIANISYSDVYWAWSSQALYGEIRWYTHPLTYSLIITFTMIKKSIDYNNKQMHQH